MYVGRKFQDHMMHHILKLADERGLTFQFHTGLQECNGNFIYNFVDGVYGHQLLARQNVAKALAAKVEEGVFDIDRAQEIATWLFVDNPTRLFCLKGE